MNKMVHLRVSVTVADLKALKWRFSAHADGSDKRGRFFIDFHETTLDDGRKIAGFKKQWRNGGGIEAGYSFAGESFGSLAELVVRLNSIAGDDPEARDD